ncbi:hypothetical protein WMY93_029014 [Mugilogobius chulae]|uniref:C1q domain-containing protein n=1 Tax=Mugilogobius chulae TaxID=88201 RepID=A0AAW0MRV7_9GOBI
MSVMSGLFLLGALSLFGLVQGDPPNPLQSLKEAALSMHNPLTCDNLNCDCAFTEERSCCCGANDMFQMESDLFGRMKDLYQKITELKNSVQEFKTVRKVAFQAQMSNSIATTSGGMTCFGPYNIDVPIPFGDVLVNDNNSYNKNLGTFTAPRHGIYVFSFTISSSVTETELLYHKVELMAQTGAVVAVWENNREDYQDSATQYVILQLNKGDQVYLRLVSGRKICTTLSSNMFSGFLLYPL